MNLNKLENFARETITWILVIGFFLVQTVIWMKHFHPFVAMKDFLFTLFISLALFVAFSYFIIIGTIKIKKSLLFILVCIYYLYNAISLVVFKYTDKNYFIIFSMLISLFFIVSYFIGEKQRDKIVYSLIFVSFLSSIYSMLQFLGIDYPLFVNYFGSRTELGSRTFTFFGNPNILGGFCVLMIPLIAGYFIRSIKQKNQFMQVYLGSNLLFAFLSLLMSQTRGSWISFGVSMVLMILLLLKENISKITQTHKKESIIAFIIILIFTISTITLIITYKNEISKTDAFNAFLNSQTLKIRMNYYKNTWKMITETPKIFLFGRGFGTFNVYYPKYRDNRIAVMLGETNMEFRVEHPHNEHLELLSDIGFFGYLIFICIIILALTNLIKKKDYVSYGIAISIIGINIDGLFSQNLRYTAISSILWLLIGFSFINFGNINLKSNESNKEKKIEITIIKIILIIILGLLIMLLIVKAYKIKNSDFYLRGALGFYTSNIPNHEQKSLILFEKAIKSDKNNKAPLYYSGIIYKTLENNNKAIEYFEKLLALDPNFIQARYFLGSAYLSQNNIEKAEYNFKEHIKTNNMYYKSYFALAYILKNTGRLSDAIKYLEEIEKINQILPIPATEYVRVQKTLIDAYIENKEFNKAEEKIKIAETLFPNEDFSEQKKALEKSLK